MVQHDVVCGPTPDVDINGTLFLNWFLIGEPTGFTNQEDETNLHGYFFFHLNDCCNNF